MSETSISSSPSKSGNSIHKTRLERKCKRSKIDLPVQRNCDQEANSDFFRNLLTHFYNDSAESTKIASPENKLTSLLENPAILSKFIPFELEKSLAAADHIYVQQISQNKAKLFPETEGFINSINISQVNNRTQCCPINEDKEGSQNESFVITESELISCCHQAEKILQNNEFSGQGSTLHELTPKKKNHMVLVNSILEDFSQSPLKQEQIIKYVALQYTPEFRLRKPPVKIYSRKGTKCTRTNLTQRFPQSITRRSSEYDEEISCCSSLSVQEDDTFCENLNNESIATTLNNTERLCENLLNLTEYFTQNELKESLEGDQQSSDLLNLTQYCAHDQLQQNFEGDQESRDDFYLLKISDLLDNILVLRSKYSSELHDVSYDSSDEFLGFSNDNNFLDDWSDDNCHDVFACINTENPFLQNKNDKLNNGAINFAADDLPSRYNPAPNNLVSFEAASSKSIHVLKGDEILSNLSDFTGKDRLLDCDMKALHKDENIFENPEDFEWNDDCDLFLNFKTPISFKESFVANTQQKDHILADASQHIQDAPSTSTSAILGFTTGAGKSVRISSKGQATLQMLLKEFGGEINNNKNYEEELKEIKCKVYSKTHNLKAESSSLSAEKPWNGDETLQTARSLQLSMSAEENLKKVKNICCLESTQMVGKVSEAKTLETFASDSKPKNALSVKTQNGTEGLLEEFVGIANDIILTDIDFSESVLSANDQTNNINAINMNFDSLSVGFQTANGKDISVSKKSKQAIETLLKEFSTDVDIEKDLKAIKTEVKIKNKVLEPKLHLNTKNDENSAELLLCEQLNMESSQSNKNMPKGFHTANGNEIPISTKAKQTVESILKEFRNDLNLEIFEEDLDDMKNADMKLNHSIVKIDVGRETDNCKQSTVSPQATQADENLLKSINTTLEVEDTEKHLKDIKINKDAVLLADNMLLKLSNHKRKMKSADNSDMETPNKTPAAKILKNDLQSSKSSLVEQSLKSPLTSATRSIIVRKNLSLTKKRKKKLNVLYNPKEEISEINTDFSSDINACILTPTRSKEPAPETPNLKEFLSNASLTSTPRINNKSQIASQTLEDSDLKPIVWKNDSSLCNRSQNKSPYATKLSECTSSNISFNSLNPTAKERMGRLRMYGKAPDVSPILIETNHNCRPSGLRRTRSMLKNPED